MNVLTDLSANQLRQAADLKSQIERLQDELNAALGVPTQPGDSAVPRRRRKMSRAARAAIAAGARARWAKIKGTTPNAAQFSSKHRMSAAAKARLSAIAKARWKKARAAGRHAL